MRVSKITTTKVIRLTLGSVLVMLCSSAEAQQTRKFYRIGYVASVSGGPASTEDALRGGLRDLGYIDGKNLFIEPRSAEGKVDRLPGLAADLVRLNVDVIVVTSIQGALAAKKLPNRSLSSSQSLKIPWEADSLPASHDQTVI